MTLEQLLQLMESAGWMLCQGEITIWILTPQKIAQIDIQRPAMLSCSFIPL